MSDVLLEVEDLSVHAGEAALVKHLSFCLRRGERLTILGETGSGKSLLMQSLIGLLPEGLSRSGRVRLAGQDLDSLPRAELEKLWGRQIAMLPQEPFNSLDPLMRAREQVVEVLECVFGEPRRSAHAEADRRLAAVGLANAGGRLPGELSGGMAQRLAFCAATAGNARIVLADEPTKGLDTLNRDALVALLAEQTRDGCLVTITHDVEVARQLPGKLLVMQAGTVVESGESTSVLRAPASAYAKSLLSAEHRGDSTPRSPLSRSAAPLLRGTHLHKKRGGKPVLKGVDIMLHAGELVGLSGPSGVGKSTLGDVLLGALVPDSGSVQLLQPVAEKRMQKIYQDPPAAFAPNVALGQLLRDVLSLHKISPDVLDELMSRTRLAHTLLERSTSEVSGGELQRMAIVRALLLDPVFLVADEPVSRLDPITSREILDLLRNLVAERDCCVLLISHDENVLRRCDRVVELSP